MTDSNATPFTETPENPVTPPANNQPTSPVVPQELQELVGAGKKYATVEDALKSIPFAQKHISTLEEEREAERQELAKLREELTKRNTTEELLEQIRTSGVPQTETTVRESISPEQISTLVNQTLEQRAAQAKAQANTDSVVQAFTEKYGDKAEEMYIALAKEANVSVASLNKWAAESPQAIIKLANLNSKEKETPTNFQSSVNTQALKPSQTEEKSARVRTGASTKELVDAWKVAGEKVRAQNN